MTSNSLPDESGVKSKAEEYLEKSANEQQLRDKWREQWVLSLAVANGAALLLLLNNLGKAEWTGIHIFVPASLFLAGIGAAGLLRLFLAFAHHSRGRYYWAYARNLDYAEAAGILGRQLPETFHRHHLTIIRAWRIAAALVEAASALLFIAGCAAAILPAARNPPPSIRAQQAAAPEAVVDAAAATHGGPACATPDKSVAKHVGPPAKQPMQ